MPKAQQTFDVGLIKESEEQGLGIDISTAGDEMVVVGMMTRGPVYDWNQANSDKKVNVGDRIVGVNGVSGDIMAMVQATKPAGGSGPVVLTLARGATKEPAAAPMAEERADAEEPAAEGGPVTSKVQVFEVRVPPPYPGIQYRKSKCMGDKLDCFAENGAKVKGVVEDNGAWLMIDGSTFLPFKAGAMQVLHFLEDANLQSSPDQSKGSQSPKKDSEEPAKASVPKFDPTVDSSFDPLQVKAFEVNVPAPYPGTQYRRSKRLDDKWELFAETGAQVKGVVEDDGAWLKINEQTFLPMKVGAIQILEPALEVSRDIETLEPELEANRNMDLEAPSTVGPTVPEAGMRQLTGDLFILHSQVLLSVAGASTGITAFNRKGECIAGMGSDMPIDSVSLAFGTIATLGAGQLRLWDIQGRAAQVLKSPSGALLGNKLLWVEALQRLVCYNSKQPANAVWFDSHGHGYTLEGEIDELVWVADLKRLVGYSTSRSELFLFDDKARGLKLEGPTNDIKGAVWIKQIQRLMVHAEVSSFKGGQPELFLFTADGKGQKLEAVTEGLTGFINVTWVDELQRLVVRAPKDERFCLVDAEGRVRSLPGTSGRTMDVVWVETLQRLVIYGRDGEVALWDAEDKYQRLQGPTTDVCRVAWGERAQRLAIWSSYLASSEIFLFTAEGEGMKLAVPRMEVQDIAWIEELGELAVWSITVLVLFDAKGRSRRLEAPRGDIVGVRWVPQLRRLASYGGEPDGQLLLAGAGSRGRRLLGPTAKVHGVVWVEELDGLLSYGAQRELFLWSRNGQSRKLETRGQEVSGVRWVDQLSSLVTFGSTEIFVVDGKQSQKQEGPTAPVHGVLWVQPLHSLVSWGHNRDKEEIFLYTEGQGKKLKGPTASINGVVWVDQLQGLVSGGGKASFDSELLLIPVTTHGGVRKLKGPTKGVRGVFWIDQIQRLVCYGDYGELFLFDTEGHGQELRGHTDDILGAVWVEQLFRLVSWDIDGGVFMWDAEGVHEKAGEKSFGEIRGVFWVDHLKRLVSYGTSQGVCLISTDGQCQQLDTGRHISVALWAEHIQRLVVCSDTRIQLFDSKCLYFEMEIPKHTSVRQAVPLERCVVARTIYESYTSVAACPDVLFLGPSGNRMKVRLDSGVSYIMEMPVETDARSSTTRLAKLFGAGARPSKLLAFTGLRCEEIFLIDATLFHQGILAAAPYSKAVSQKLLALPSRYALEISIAQYMAQVVLTAISLGQLAGFAFKGVAPPPSLKQPAHFLVDLQHFGLDPKNLHMEDADLYLFLASLAVVAMFLAAFILQELVEWYHFLKPKDSIWSMLGTAMNLGITVMAGPLFLPVLQIVLWPFQESTAKSSNVAILRAPSALFAAVLVAYSARFERVDKQLGRINAGGWGMIWWGCDRRPSEEDRDVARRHPLSPMSPVHDMTKLGVKVVLTVAHICMEGVSLAASQLALGVMLVYNDYTKDQFHPSSGSVDFNAVTCAATTGITLNYAAALGAAIVTSQGGALEESQPLLLCISACSLPAAFGAYRLRRTAPARHKRGKAVGAAAQARSGAGGELTAALLFDVSAA